MRPPAAPRLLRSIRASRAARVLIALVLVVAGQASTMRAARGSSCARGGPAAAAGAVANSGGSRRTIEGGAITASTRAAEAAQHASGRAIARAGVTGSGAPAAPAPPLRCTNGPALPTLAAGAVSERPSGGPVPEGPRALRDDAPEERPFHPPRRI